MVGSRKRLIICCDGTGRDSIRERNDYLTNVARFARCVKQRDGDGILQLVYYHEGVAMHNGQFQYREAATGQGIHGMIQSAYYFLCMNFDFDAKVQDEIHLVGFSRGAFVVRALACFIEAVGILAKMRLAMLPMVYALWKNQELEQLESHIEAWQDKGLLVRPVEIATCGAWDTVSAIHPTKDLLFVNDTVPRILKHAFQALALHETRTAFPPILWNLEAQSHTQISQCWLAGDHSDIGGGHLDSGLAAISLLWMVARYREYTNVAFDEVMLLDCMTPLYLHWQEAALFDWEERNFFNKQEYSMSSHVYTRGNVHGSESWTTSLWRMPGQSSLLSREHFFEPAKLENIVPSAPFRQSKPPANPIRVSNLLDHAFSSAMSLLDQGHSSNTGLRFNPITRINTTPKHQDWPRVHFTVRLLMSERKQFCHLLERFTNAHYGPNIAWQDVTGSRGFFEDTPTIWESWVFRQWIKREEELFSKEDVSNGNSDRFTRFLYPFRREGERPRKAFYAPRQRTSSVDRGTKIKDANDMVAEAAEKCPDLTESDYSAATSVGSGIRYYLDLDYEGYFPDRYRRFDGPDAAWRSLQLRGRFPSGRPDLRRKDG